MSRRRTSLDAGFADYSKLKKGPSGRNLCRQCSTECKGKRQTFCSDKCVSDWKIKTDPGHVRHLIHKRDKGVCASCGLDTEAIAGAIDILRELAVPTHGLRARMPEVWKLREAVILAMKRGGNRTTYWDADHIKPIAEGGGECDLENYQTLCIWCHRAKSSNARKKPKTSGRVGWGPDEGPTC